MSQIINLTPHTVTVQGCTSPTGDAPAAWSVAPSGRIARATEDVHHGEPIDGIPTTWIRYTGVVDLPDPAPGTWYLVSSLAAQAAYQSGRPWTDLLVPGEQVRDSQGRIAGCRSLCRWTPPRSTFAYLESLRFWSAERTQTEYGYACEGASDDDLHKIAEIAEQLVASLCPGPGDTSIEATRAVQEALVVLETAQHRERLRRDTLAREASDRTAERLADMVRRIRLDASPALVPDWAASIAASQEAEERREAQRAALRAAQGY